MNKEEALYYFKRNRRYRKDNQRKTIKGQILAGDIEGAIKGLNKIKSIRLNEMEKRAMASG